MAQIAFGVMRDWMTDLAVSLVTLSVGTAKAAGARPERDLGALARIGRQA
jgi:hypothetical protein